ncbi:MAG TPA: hypothetical protein VFP17_09465 [Solirubrobacterales bacterium]|nr:hypothetical protein [Solirubrobacterales bacterium]
MAKRSMALLLLCLGALLVVPALAQAAPLTITKWESLTCKEDNELPVAPGVPEPGYESTLPTPPEQCVGTDLSKLYTQAAGHPNFGITDFRIATYPAIAKIGGFPTSFVKDIVVNTPEGLSVNPQAAPECEVATFEEGKCPAASIVGFNYLTVAAQSPAGSPPECAPAGECLQARVKLPVYNLVPFEGHPSMVGFLSQSGATFIVGSLSPVDQHVIFTISDIHPPSPTSPPIIESRLVFNGRAGNGTYLTMPSNCAGGQTSTLFLDSQGPPYEAEQTSDEASYTTPTGATGCENVPFDPSIGVSAPGGAVDSPDPTTVNVDIPFEPGPENISNSYLKVARVTLPKGMGINPSVANGLQVCTDDQFHYHTDLPVECPEASKIGTVEVQTPSLPPNSLFGDVYAAAPLNNNPSSGEEFRIFIHAFSTRYGVNVRLKGNVFPDLQTGQLTAVVAENPQATFSSFRLHFNTVDNKVLTLPPTCGQNTATSDLTPWSERADANPSADLALSNYPGGGNCPKTMADRPFGPSYNAKPDSSKAGSYSPFHVLITRKDGEQELKVVNVTLPKGLTGKLAGIPYCPEAAIAAAANSSGAAEKANPSCPGESLLGSAVTRAGTGNNPFKIGGNVYLAGPYKGAPLSLVTVTPSIAGPYDLGTVVVRVALFVEPETAQIHAVSDVIPDVFGGVKLDLRSINLDIDRSQFMINPTNCAAQATTGAINGGGADPTNSATFSSYAVNDPFQATECNKLGFKPKLKVTLNGPTKRAKNPRLTAVLNAKKGQANVLRTALTMPHSLFLDQGHIGTVCTRPQLASHSCPKNSVYGHAEAKSPLLDKKLKGKVFLVSSNHELPDLLVDLRGQVEIYLRGVISSKHGGLKTVFNNVPDVPVSRFALKMKGGKKSLLVNSTNTCAKPQRAKLNIKGQNGKKVKNNKFKLNIASCKKHKKK